MMEDKLEESAKQEAAAQEEKNANELPQQQVLATPVQRNQGRERPEAQPARPPRAHCPWRTRARKPPRADSGPGALPTRTTMSGSAPRRDAAGLERFGTDGMVRAASTPHAAARVGTQEAPSTGRGADMTCRATTAGRSTASRTLLAVPTSVWEEQRRTSSPTGHGSVPEAVTRPLEAATRHRRGPRGQRPREKGPGPSGRRTSLTSTRRTGK